MTLSFGDIRILLKALTMAANRHRTYANRAGCNLSPSAAKGHDDKASRMLELHARLKDLRPRHDVLEVRI